MLKDRTTLKGYFLPNAVPTADNFKDLIDSAFNPLEDSIKKLPSGPVAVEAQPDKGGTQEMLHFFKSFKDTNPAWRMNLNGGLNVLDASSQSRLFIRENNGNVGISQSNPQGKLHISGGNFVVEGNIGINTATPNFPFTFGNAIGPKIALWSNGNSIYGFGIAPNTLQIHSDGNWSDIALGSFNNTFAETMRLKGNGNVGIGTGNPQSKLHINGGNLVIENGRVGIGTTSPYSQLSNTDKNTIASDGNGGNPGSFAWSANQAGYAGQFYNEGNAGNSHGIVIKIASNTATALDVSQGPQTIVSTSIFTVKGNGNVGIGTNNPQAKLHVEGGMRRDYSATAYHYLNGGGTAAQPATRPGGNVFDVSILATSRVIAPEFNAVSDRRIKKDFLENDPQLSLQMLNQIRIKDYRYKDEITKGNVIQKGVVAQELEEIMPGAVSSHSDFVPDIYALPETASVKDAVLTIALANPHYLQAGDVIRLMTSTGAKDVTVATAEGHCFSVNDWQEGGNDIFVYGKKVNDFRTVNYNNLFCLGISAVQALHRQMQQLKDELNGLKEKLSATLIPAF